MVRAQQHSKPPQPLLTVLPSATATGRNGSVLPSMTMVSPMCAWSRYSPAMRRMVAAGTSQMPAAHSGVYGFMCASSLENAVSPCSRPWRQNFFVRTDFDRLVHGNTFKNVGNQGLFRSGIPQEEPVRPDQVRRRGVVLQEFEIEPRARLLVQHHVDERVEERGIGLGLDRHPLGGAGAGDRQVRLDLHALHAADARLGMAPDADHAARGLGVGAAGNHVLAERRVGRHGEGAVPEFAVQVLRMRALHALPRAEAHVDRAPGAEERREGAHVGLRRAAAAEARGDARIAGLVEQVLLPLSRGVFRK